MVNFRILKLFILIFFLTGSQFTKAQNIDSLKAEWEKAGNDLRLKLDISSKISDLYFNVHLDSLEKYSTIQINLAKSLNDEKSLELGYSSIGSIYFRKGNTKKALYYYEKAKSLAKKNQDTPRIMTISINIASLYIVQGKNVDALKNYFIAKNNLFRIKETEGRSDMARYLKMEANLDNNIGIAYFNMNDFSNATRFYSSALTIATKLKDTMLLSKVYTNLGEIELLEENYNVAQDFLYKGKRFKEKLKDSIALKINYLMIGVLYLELGQLDKARIFFQTTEEMLGQSPDKGLEKKLWINYAVYYLRLNRVNKALDFLYQAKELNMSEYALQDDIKINRLLSDAHFLLKNYEKSNLHREIYEGIRDSIYNSEIGLEIARMELYYNIQNKNLRDSLDRQEERLKKGQEIHLKEVQNFYLILWLIFLAIAFAAIVYFLNIVRKRNKELKKSIKEKEALMKEVHHRVKNNFQIISSMLNIQANKLRSKKIVGPMLNMQNRIIAMSLVHEKLYVSEFQEAVYANEYFEDLVNSISVSLLTKKSVIKIHNDGEDFLIPLEKAIPTGLIANELITNSIKYGVEDEQNFSIDLYLKHDSNGQVTLTLKDNGKGFPEDFDPTSYEDSIGLELVFVLIDQLDGEIEFKNDNGAVVTVKFNLDQI